MEGKGGEDDDFEREMSRNMRLNGERRLRVEDISFESETFNIYDPFFSSESDEDYSGSSFDSLSSYGSETDNLSIEDDSSNDSSDGRGDCRNAEIRSLAPFFATSNQGDLSGFMMKAQPLAKAKRNTFMTTIKQSGAPLHHERIDASYNAANAFQEI